MSDKKKKKKKKTKSDVDKFGSFSHRAPDNPHMNFKTQLEGGEVYQTNSETREEHDSHAKQEERTIRLKQGIMEQNFWHHVIGDTPCLQTVLKAMKPHIKGNKKLKACWIHLAMKCPGINVAEEHDKL